ncbi:FHA domain-containing protein [Rhodanobacter denitrificans]|uniref:FHA domain-containing protein n=1 Tax=Rhodanobacter denitrificans TaxID=666685 RepID=UPI0009DB13D1|nr:FHA domain-containing protein [Rhodanobacter denitrificans]UJM91132.1 FHA domain-containing protein [Rhodanobacter denitrificans]
MQARLTAFVPDHAALTRSLSPGDRLRIGRADDCGLLLEHPSISRAHAELFASDDGRWQLADLRSKNGSFVEGARIDSASIDTSCWLRFGDVHCEFALLDGAAAEADARRRNERHRTATACTAHLDTIARKDRSDDAPGQSLPDASLRAVAELAGCSRGFLLVDTHGRYRVLAALALDPSQMIGREFAGSLSAVTRAIEQRRPVVFNDIGGDVWPGACASVVQAGLRTLVCLPLLDGNRVLGAIYADRREPGPPLTTLDLELLEAFADRTALWLIARRAREDLAMYPSTPPLDWNSILTERILET